MRRLVPWCFLLLSGGGPGSHRGSAFSQDRPTWGSVGCPRNYDPTIHMPLNFSSRSWQLVGIAQYSAEKRGWEEAGWTNGQDSHCHLLLLGKLVPSSSLQGQAPREAERPSQVGAEVGVDCGPVCESRCWRQVRGRKPPGRSGPWPEPVRGVQKLAHSHLYCPLEPWILLYCPLFPRGPRHPAPAVSALAGTGPQH